MIWFGNLFAIRVDNVLAETNILKHAFLSLDLVIEICVQSNWLSWMDQHLDFRGKKRKGWMDDKAGGIKRDGEGMGEGMRGGRV